MRNFEGLLTAVYQYQIRDGWTLQPNFQYIIHPRWRSNEPFRTSSRNATQECFRVRVADDS
jgi:carbohydrate-selective porin OprB